MFDYLRDPMAIEEQSFRQIRELTDLSAFDKDAEQVAMRLVHTCGEPNIISSLRMTKNAAQMGIQAIKDRATILCDVEMVKHGLAKRYVGEDIVCHLNHPDVPTLAKQRGETRSMAALDFWRDQLGDSIVVIGNAPTALFRLMEMIEGGAPRPALIVGMPVGFIGAAESKDALWTFAEQHNLSAITLLGRQGGSALAAATINAIARMAHGVRF